MEEEEEDLPFPQPIRRAAFSTEDFDQDAFLADAQKHQTLEDLRAELRGWSRELAQELVDLIHRDYSDFVGLGEGLAGSEDKTEDVKLGLLTYRRELEAIAANLARIVRETDDNLHELQTVKAGKRLARRLLCIHGHMEMLEEEGVGEVEDMVGMLETLEGEWRLVPQDHPFLRAHHHRVAFIKQRIRERVMAVQDPGALVGLLARLHVEEGG